MSKYTTEVRFICETDCGLKESEGYHNINDILNACWNKTFDSNVEIFDENYRALLCKKILKHYYTREIGAETVGLWKFWMNRRFEEIMPYYNQLYKSALLEFNPLYDVDLTTRHNRKNDEDKQEDITRKDNTQSSRNTTVNRDSDGSSSTNRTTDETKRDLYSDTPQGAITGVESEKYLTNARKITQDETEKTNSNFTQNDNTRDNSNFNEDVNAKTTNIGAINSTEEYLETVKGKRGGVSFSSLLSEYRKTFLNIDMLVIEEFSDLFFGLW